MSAIYLRSPGLSLGFCSYRLIFFWEGSLPGSLAFSLVRGFRLIAPGEAQRNPGQNHRPPPCATCAYSLSSELSWRGRRCVIIDRRTRCNRHAGVHISPVFPRQPQQARRFRRRCSVPENLKIEEALLWHGNGDVGFIRRLHRRQLAGSPAGANCPFPRP